MLELNRRADVLKGFHGNRSSPVPRQHHQMRWPAQTTSSLLRTVLVTSLSGGASFLAPFLFLTYPHLDHRLAERAKLL